MCSKQNLDITVSSFLVLAISHPPSPSCSLLFTLFLPPLRYGNVTILLLLLFLSLLLLRDVLSRDVPTPFSFPIRILTPELAWWPTPNNEPIPVEKKTPNEIKNVRFCHNLVKQKKLSRTLQNSSGKTT